MRPTDTYPRFDRIGSSTGTGDSFVSFADPTLALSPELRLGWYLGASGWDPIHSMVSVVQRALEVSGAKSLIFVGGSGGGFAALRTALHFKDARVFCFNPQIDVSAYHPRAVENYVRIAHGGNAENAFEADPARTDMVHAYRDANSRPKVFYSQNISDAFHIRNHYLPFKRSMSVIGADGTSADGQIRFHLYDSERDGHAAPAPREFRSLFSQAVDWYRADSPIP
ncbi:hypothetical protein MWU57_04535 [Isoptericola sp. S6320L]|uniref:hypothetical protein n=1 Tax=Isoptericola sp. S6320L TaxID=2926411 RepID=UPI001FF4B544|nr:hypothetical protein [Isoptericola sp. S6320L]MCK0116293.1 hypothetical protein [Isoptericola sp. S6320L]